MKKYPIHICFVTGSRAEYDRVVSLLKALKSHSNIKLDVIATGAHLSPQFGMTVKTISNDGFKIAARVKTLHYSSDEKGVIKSIGAGMGGLAEAFSRIKPDAVMLFGDRAELLAAASAAVCLHIPLIHLCGGEITEGAIDDQVRHMLTKASHLHFAANDAFAERILQMGEEDRRVIVSGSPALDMIHSYKRLSKRELEKDLELDLSRPTALVTYHPVTLDSFNLDSQIRQLLRALTKAPLQYILTYPNADAKSDFIISKIKAFAKKERKRVCLVQNLGMLRFLSSLKYVRMIIGNSSSGIVEAPSFNLPAVNIGDRQAGRVFGKNVIQAGYSESSISSAIKKAMTYSKSGFKNPYGDGKSSARIVKAINHFFTKYSRTEILHKKFIRR